MMITISVQACGNSQDRAINNCRAVPWRNALEEGTSEWLKQQLRSYYTNLCVAMLSL